MVKLQCCFYNTRRNKHTEKKAYHYNKHNISIVICIQRTDKKSLIWFDTFFYSLHILSIHKNIQWQLYRFIVCTLFGCMYKKYTLQVLSYFQFALSKWFYTSFVQSKCVLYNIGIRCTFLISCTFIVIWNFVLYKLCMQDIYKFSVLIFVYMLYRFCTYFVVRVIGSSLV